MKEIFDNKKNNSTFSKTEHMEIQQKEDSRHGKFFIEKDGTQMAEIDYTLSGGDTLIINHTEVDDALRGQKVGYLLVEHVVEYARKNNLKIIPLCTFAAVVFKKKTAEYADVLKK
jgi:predicted GNAT family acetyltransferase